VLLIPRLCILLDVYSRSEERQSAVKIEFARLILMCAAKAWKRVRPNSYMV